MVVPSLTVAWLNIFIVPKHVKTMTSLGGVFERMFISVAVHGVPCPHSENKHRF